ncbi:MAG: hypothetical protein ACRELB_13965, partial [Polyangiaceae bacterium]
MTWNRARLACGVLGTLPALAGCGGGAVNDCSDPGYAALNASCARDASAVSDGGVDVRSDAKAGDGGGVEGSSEAGCQSSTPDECGGACTNTQTDPSNCGTCGKACPGPEGGAGGATCTAGTCTLGCSGTTPDNCSGGCVNLSSDPNHCGVCSNACPGPTTAGTGHAACAAGADGGPGCSLACTGSTGQACGADCVDPTSPAHCGSSCLVCPGPTTGAGSGSAVCTVGDAGVGACSVLCATADSQQCPGAGGAVACYAPNDLNNCGTCGHACVAPPSTQGQAVCVGSPLNCDVTCNANFHKCVTASAPGGDCLSNSDTPSVTTDPCIINEMFGIFVSPGGTDSASCGSQLSPCKTIGQAMDLAKAAGKRVYACGSAGNYTIENLVVGSSRDGVKAYGGLNCTTTPSQWTYNATDKATMAPASGYALQISGLATGVAFEDFGFVSANEAAAAAGTSSIAVFANSASGVVFTGCTMQAGTAAQGQDQQPVAQAAPAPSGNPGGASKATGGSGAGGPQQPNPSCSTSIGGAGGSAVTGELDGQSGQV